ncbi:hypothetical protein AMTRI_Chr01g130500 [Amborella trichopoda]
MAFLSPPSHVSHPDFLFISPIRNQMLPLKHAFSPTFTFRYTKFPLRKKKGKEMKRMGTVVCSSLLPLHTDTLQWTFTVSSVQPRDLSGLLKVVEKKMKIFLESSGF